MLISQTEAETRVRLIDGALEQAEWNLDNPQEVGQEISVHRFDPAEWQKVQKQIRRMSDEQGIYTALPAGISQRLIHELLKHRRLFM